MSTQSLFVGLVRLLKAYSELGWYVRPLVLTVKHWAKRRHINDASSGTLSSYAYVIMVIHFLQTQYESSSMLPCCRHIVHYCFTSC
jgi:terminal uridylyltransferase